MLNKRVFTRFFTTVFTTVFKTVFTIVNKMIFSVGMFHCRVVPDEPSHVIRVPCLV